MLELTSLQMLLTSIKHIKPNFYFKGKIIGKKDLTGRLNKEIKELKKLIQK